MNAKKYFNWTAGQASWPVLRLSKRDKELSNWLKFRSVCAAESSFTQKTSSLPIVAVVKNLLLRGWPTAVSQKVDDWLSSSLGLTALDPEKKEFETAHIFKEDNDGRVVRGIQFALSQLDSRPNPSSGSAKKSLPDYGSKTEEYAGENILRNVLGAWAPITFRRQGALSETSAGFEGQNADFIMAIPPIGEREIPRLWAIEVDGPQHLEIKQKSQDSRRDLALAKTGGGTIRIPVESGNTKSFGISRSTVERRVSDSDLGPLLQRDPFLVTMQKNMESPMWAKPSALRWLQHINAPIAIARVQRAIIHALEAEVLSLKDNAWTIAIDERDVPCGNIAIQDLAEIFDRLAILSNRSFLSLIHI